MSAPSESGRSFLGIRITRRKVAIAVGVIAGVVSLVDESQRTVRVPNPNYGQNHSVYSPDKRPFITVPKQGEEAAVKIDQGIAVGSALELAGIIYLSVFKNALVVAVSSRRRFSSQSAQVFPPARTKNTS